jgi:prephenate dehydrogenase
MKVGIFGLGLAGAGVGMEVRASLGQAVTVVGFDEDPDRIRESLAAGAVDETVPDAAALAAMPTVLVAVEPAALAATFRRLAPHLRPGSVVSDVSPVRSPGVRLAGEFLPSTVSYVGSHPLERPGPPLENEDARRVWCLVPGRGATSDAIGALRDLAVAMDYRPLILTAEEHDLTVAGTHHLPFLARAALLSTVAGSAGWRDLAPFAAGLAAEETAILAVDDLVANRVSIAHWLGRLQERLEEVRVLLDTPDEDGLARLVEDLTLHEARLTASGDGSSEPGFARRVAGGLFGNRLANIFDRRPVP